MQTKQVESVYKPILGRTLGVAVRSVIGINDDTKGKFADSWNDPQRQEKNIFHLGELFGEDLRTQDQVKIVFRHPGVNPNRIIVHFRRSRRGGDPIPPMAVGRASEAEPWKAFTLDPTDKDPNGRNFIQPVYMSPQKPAGFEPLFVKVMNGGAPTYIKVEVEESGDSEGRFLTVTASKVNANEAPEHLRNI